MDLDARQTRSFYLAGTVALPKPFPTLGTISFKSGQLTAAPGERPQDKNLVLVNDFQGNRTIVRLMLQEDVAAIFVPGERDGRGAFQPSAHVESIDKGEWFVGSDVNAATIRARLNIAQQIDVASRNSVIKGIVFVGKDRRIFKVTEDSQAAGDDEDPDEFYPCCPCWKICC
jgi:hypothetical protein